MIFLLCFVYFASDECKCENKKKKKKKTFFQTFKTEPYSTNQGPVVQSIISLTSSLVVKMLTVLVNTISNSQVLKFFSKNINVYAIFNDQSFDDMLNNDIVSFEQPGQAFFGSLYLLNIWLKSLLLLFFFPRSFTSCKLYTIVCSTVEFELHFYVT